MKKNEGLIDRIARVVIGISIIGAGIYYQAWWGLIGIIPLLTGGMGRCPLYYPCKIDTRSEHDKDE